MRDNLLFGLKHRPIAPAKLDDATRTMREAFWRRSERAGNPPLDPTADWIDYELAGATGPGDLLPCIVKVLEQVEFDEDIYSLGLRGAIDAEKRPDLAEKILKVRHVLHDRLQGPDYASLVEPFNVDHYNRNLSVAENLLFGTPVGKDYDGDNLAADPYMQTVLHELGLDQDLLRMGLSIAETMVELFSGLSPDNPLFEQYSFISADELPNVRLLLQRLGGKGAEAVPDADRVRLTTLPLRYIEARHRLGLIDAAMEDRLLAARRAFRARLPGPLRGQSSSTISAATTVPPPCRTTSCSAAWSMARPRRAAHRHPDPPGPRRAVAARFGDRGRAGLQRRRRRQAPGRDPAAEARHRPCADQAAAVPGGERGGRGIRRPHAGQNS